MSLHLKTFPYSYILMHQVFVRLLTATSSSKYVGKDRDFETRVNLKESTLTIMFGYRKIVEKKIKDAEKNGEFDNLPGKGKPLNLEDDSRIPEDLRLAYKILKNADCLPPEIELKKEIKQMEDMLENIPDEKERYRQIKKINLKIMKLNMMGHKSPLLEECQIYYGKIIDKLGRK